MASASVVIVGAGVIGASVAYHLAARGWRNVLVLDRAGAAGRGSTGAATGGFRAQFGTAIHVRLSLLSRDKLRTFASEVGVDPGYRPTGYLWLACTEAEMAALRAALRVQHAEGLSEAVEVSPAEAGRLNAALRLDRVIGGAFCPTDGFVSPMRLLEGYLAAARRLGARVECDVEVVGFARGGRGRIETVRTSRGEIGVEGVVNAAGAWAAALAGLAGVDLPVAPLRRQVAVTVPCDALPESMPMTIFAGDGFHFRQRDGRVLLLQPSPGVPGRPFDTRLEPEWVESVAALARRRVPALERVPIDIRACWAGLYEMTPDRHALLGPAPGCPNLFLACGSSGHGVMHAPALGHLLAEIMSEGAASTLDAAALRPSRFAEGAPNPSSDLL